MLAMIALALASAGCDSGNAKSPYEISVDQGSSALLIPRRVDRVTKRIRADEAKAKETIAAMPTMAEKFEETDWKVVLQIVEAANEAGKDGGYGAEMRDLRASRAFFDDQKEEITKKVGGSVQYAVKQKGCDVDAWGAVSVSMKESIDERVEERTRASNDAFLHIERNREPLGEKNIPALEQMADKIAHASFVVHVEIPEAKEELEGTVNAAGEARKKIQKLLQEEQAAPTHKPNAKEQKSQKDRIKQAEDGLKLLDEAEADAKDNLASLEQRAKDLVTSYDAALGKLKDAVKAKQSK